MNRVNLSKLATMHPDTSITIEVTDLLSLGRLIAAEVVATVRKELRNEERLISAADCAKILACSTRTLQNLAKAGELGAPAKSGGNNYYRLSDIRKYINKCFENNQ